MKLLDLNCPKCGAQLKIDDKITKGVCEHCGTVVLIDDEARHIQYDNAEEAGYSFEKGRQRARAEAQMISNQTNSSMGIKHPPKKKRRTWLWVLGWIFIFPVPLTVLIARSKLKKPVKVALIVILWAIILLIAALNKNPDSARPVPNPSDIYTPTAYTPSNNNVVESEPDYKELFATEMKDDNVIFQGYVLNDVTDRWRLCEVVSNEQVVNHAVTYYRAYFEDDKEVHAVINFHLKTTTKITVDGIDLYVDVHEYVDGEENDANALFSGMLYGSYIINKVTEEITKLEIEESKVTVEEGVSFSEVLKQIAEDEIISRGGICDIELDGSTVFFKIDGSNISLVNNSASATASVVTTILLDAFLEYRQFDNEWDSVVVDWEGVGRLVQTKDDIDDTGAYGRYFNFTQDDWDLL